MNGAAGHERASQHRLEIEPDSRHLADSNDWRLLVNWRSYALGLLVVQLQCAPATADELRSAEAKKLVELLRLKDSLQTSKGMCSSLKDTNSPEKIDAKDSGYFGGIHPGDAKWGAVVAAYREYVDAICLHPTVDEGLALAQKEYEAALSEADLRAALNFYSSPAGQNLLKGHRNVQLVLADESKRRQSEDLSPALVEFRRKLDAILKGARQ